MRDEDQAYRDAQHERRTVDSPLFHGSELLASLSLFVSVYLAIFIAVGRFVPHGVVQWVALLSASCATVATIRIWEHGRWRVGLVAPPRLALRELALGTAFATLLILTCDALIILTTDLRHIRDGGFPWRDMALVFVPAALHEELAFRGYVFQKLRRWNRAAAIAVSSAVFALLHAGNIGASPLAIVNIVLAGVLLALAYERFERLWFPIGIHFAWNVVSGPILGFPVSGFVARESVFRLVGSDSVLMTGGTFGMEGSVWMMVTEIAGIAALLNAERRMQNAERRKRSAGIS